MNTTTLDSTELFDSDDGQKVLCSPMLVPQEISVSQMYKRFLYFLPRCTVKEVGIKASEQATREILRTVDSRCNAPMSPIIIHLYNATLYGIVRYIPRYISVHNGTVVQYSTP